MRILIAGDDAHVAHLAPWASPVLGSRHDVRVLAGPSKIDLWEPILACSLFRETPRPDVVMLFLGAAHVDGGYLPSVAPILRTVRLSGARLVWVGPPKAKSEGAVDRVSELAHSVESAGETFVDSTAMPIDFGPDGGTVVLTPPSARSWLVRAGASLPTKVDTKDLSDEFFLEGDRMASRLNIDFLHLLFVMNVESGLYASAQNADGCVGLIQFCDVGGRSGLAAVGFPGQADKPTTPEMRTAFKALGAEGQLPYVETFLKNNAQKHLDSAVRLYQAIFLPATLDDPSDTIASSTGTRWGGQEATFYKANMGLDPLRTGAITKDTLALVLQKAAGQKRFQAALARYSALTGRILPGVVPAHKTPNLVPVALALGAVGASALMLQYLEHQGRKMAARPMRGAVAA